MAKTRKRKRQVFQMVAGISLNGKIADKTGDFRKYSSKEDQRWLKKKIEESDALVMGRKTYEKHAAKTTKPMIVFTKSIKTLKTQKPVLFMRKSEKGIEYAQRNQEVHWFHDSPETLRNLCDLLGYRTVTVLGGAEIYHWFLQKNLLTDIFLTLEPQLIGSGTSLLRGAKLTDLKKWKLEASKKLNKNGTILLHYQP